MTIPSIIRVYGSEDAEVLTVCTERGTPVNVIEQRGNETFPAPGGQWLWVWDGKEPVACNTEGRVHHVLRRERRE